MKTLQKAAFAFTLMVLALFTLSAHLNAQQLSETFENIRRVSIETVSSDCIVERGGNDKVRVELTHTYDDDEYEPEVKKRGDELRISERFFGRHRSRHGRSKWTLTVPQEMDIEFSTASGDLLASNVKGDIDARTASGDIELSNMDGNYDLSTASGDIDIQSSKGRLKFSTASGDMTLSTHIGNIRGSTASGSITARNTEGNVKFSAASGDVRISSATGNFDLSAASGNVTARDMTISGESEFSAASGDVEVSLASELTVDIQISSASGDAELDFNRNRIQGFITMTAKARRGRIRAPFEFDDEEYYDKWGDEYVTKTVEKGGNRPRIEISTASGVASLVQ